MPTVILHVAHDSAASQVRRLAKASRHSDALAVLASARADTRTALESEAYASIMAGTWLMEKESDWSAALKKLTRAQYAYDHSMPCCPGSVCKLQHHHDASAFCTSVDTRINTTVLAGTSSSKI